ncbi:hypothetical protein PVK06_012284 [Gossypium arboreum]|uniref:Uncharacterized protein n=1 Tax=Gossypium arboreum TaxID=29729 RepID=A0ABR0QBR9_GOSAR|nr:hypothetical protein PVK06_012284 [Gossypium arboreum]
MAASTLSVTGALRNMEKDVEWPDNIANSSLQDWLNYIVSSFSTTTCRAVICTLWYIWSTRNRLIHDRRIILSQDIIHIVEAYIREVNGVQRKLPVKRVKSERWRLLEASFLKVNFDAAFKGNDRRSCTEIVTRN